MLVLVAGTSGGVETAAVQPAKLRGARVIALADHGKADAIRELGADDVVASRDADLEAAVWAAADGRGVAVAVDVGPAVLDPLPCCGRSGATSPSARSPDRLDIHAAQRAFRREQAAGNFVIRVAQGR